MIKNVMYQIGYDNSQIDHTEKDFLFFNNKSSNQEELYEFGVMLNFYNWKYHKSSERIGFCSWKFRKKTNINGETFLKWINENPEYDVYFINPYPCQLGYKSVWEQAEASHKGIVKLTQEIFDSLDYKIDLKSIINDGSTTSYCNFWIGNSEFFEKYMKFTIPIYEMIKNNPEFNKRVFEFSDKVRPGSSYFPFIFERLFSTLLIYDKTIKSKHYEYSFIKKIEKRFFQKYL